MKIKRTNINVLHNKYILYFFLFLNLVNLYYLTITRDYATACILLLVGFIVSFFNKNMIIVLFVSIVVANIVKYGAIISREGFEDDENENNDETEKEDEDEDENENENEETSDKNKKKNKEKKELFKNLNELLNMFNEKDD